MRNDQLSPYQVSDDGELLFDYHEGQRRAMSVRKRFILVSAGTQSGKTIFGPWWLHREIRMRGPGDYLIVAPDYPLMKKKALPEFLNLFKDKLKLGSYHKADKVFVFSDQGSRKMFGSEGDVPTKIFLGHAQDSESLEAATAKAAWLDEIGQSKVRVGAWEAIQRRLSIHQGRALMTTTPYTIGWLKNEVYDRASDGDENIALVQFDSTMNPAFPEAEFSRMRKTLPGWKFNMMYRGQFERPAGMIYDVWDRDLHIVPDSRVPDEWPRYMGQDYGGVNTAAVYLAQEPGTKRYVAYRTYHEGGRTAEQHASQMLKNEPRQPDTAGGAPSENQWRHEFGQAGLPVRQPRISDVEIGIGHVYAMLKATAETDFAEPHLVVQKGLKALIDEIESYSRVLNDRHEPTEKIADKSEYHLLDALRYIVNDIVTRKEVDWKV